MARRGVTVNAVAPGLIETELTRDFTGNGADSNGSSALLDAIPARRPGTPEEVAACIRFLASDQAGLRDRGRPAHRRRHVRLTLINHKEKGDRWQPQPRTRCSERVIAALVEFGEEPENVKPDSRFEDLDIDSLDLVELAQVIEDEYEIEVTDADMDKIATVQDVVDFVAERQS